MSGPHSRAPRRAAVTLVLALLVLLLLAAEAQAYVPGQLIWAKRIGTSTSEAGAWDVTGGPGGVAVLAGWQIVPGTGQVPMVARFKPGGTKWVRTYDVPGYAHEAAVDRAGNIYVAATVNPSAGGDIVLLKYNAAGVFQWATTPYDGGAWDDGRQVAVDGAGNIVVAGTSGTGGRPTGIVVFKYDPNGTMLWAGPARYDPDPGDPNAGDTYLLDLALDAAGDVYVAGSSMYNVGGRWIESALALKFAGADGTRLNGFIYEPARNPSSYFESLTIRGARIVAVGETWDPAKETPGDALVVRFDTSLAQKNRKEWGAGNKTGEWFSDAVIDGKGNVFVTGDQWLEASGGYDKAVTIKFNPTLSKILWKATYLPASREAEGWYIARDSLGNVFVAGEKVTGTYYDFLLIKYSPAGALKWLKTWSAGGPDDDEASGLVLGANGDVFIGGQVTGKGDIYQAALLRYKR